MIFYNSDLKYNRISFNINIKTDNTKEYLSSLFIDAKKDNLKIIERLPHSEIIYVRELKLDKTYSKETQFLDTEHCKLINENYLKVKEDYMDIIKILGLYLINPVKIEYFENYYIK